MLNEFEEKAKLMEDDLAKFGRILGKISMSAERLESLRVIYSEVLSKMSDLKEMYNKVRNENDIYIQRVKFSRQEAELITVEDALTNLGVSRIENESECRIIEHCLTRINKNLVNNLKIVYLNDLDGKDILDVDGFGVKTAALILIICWHYNINLELDYSKLLNREVEELNLYLEMYQKILKFQSTEK